MRTLVALMIASTLLIGCEQTVDNKTGTTEAKAPSPETVAAETVAVFQDPIIPTIVELPTHALPVWREHREQKPTLVLFSNDPFLKAIPEEITEDADQLVKDGSINELMAGLDIMTANPVLMQDMAVSAAINSELFSAIYWVVATPEGILQQSEASIQEHLLLYGAFTEEQPVDISKTETGFVGMIDNVPVHIVPPESLPLLKPPVSLHIDLSYFSSIYLDEVRSPLFSLIKDLFINIRSQQWQAIAVTISLNHASGTRPLKSRYLGPTIATFFNKPERLDADLAEGLKIRQQILYIDTFFQNETILELYQEALEKAPDDPSLHYGLYQLYRQMRKHDLAMEELRQAVVQDRVYAFEYLDLAQQSKEQGQKLMAMDFLQLGTQSFPENVFIKLQLAETYLEVNSAERATTLIKSLQAEPWSELYYPQVPEMLSGWLEQAKNAPASTTHGN